MWIETRACKWVWEIRAKLKAWNWKFSSPKKEKKNWTWELDFYAKLKWLLMTWKQMSPDTYLI